MFLRMLYDPTLISVEALSRTQQKELDTLQQEVVDNGNGLDIPEVPLDNDGVNIGKDGDSSSDAGSEYEIVIVQELGLSNASSERSKGHAAKHEAWTLQLPMLSDIYIDFCSAPNIPSS